MCLVMLCAGARDAAAGAVHFSGMGIDQDLSAPRLAGSKPAGHTDCKSMFRVV